MASYDEDLMANKFFTSMVKKCPELYSTAATNRWTVSEATVSHHLNIDS